jgi:hypothetical protein
MKQSSPLTRCTERTIGFAGQPLHDVLLALAAGLAVEREPDVRPYGEAELRRIDLRRVAAHQAAALEVADALGDRLAREPELAREVRAGAAAVLRQQQQQTAIDRVQRGALTYVIFGSAVTSVNLMT